jgi:hypothetical protein
VSDFSAEAQPFFNKDRASGAPRATIVDANTLAGHPGALAALHRLLAQKCSTTETSGRLLRHGIMHGRELGYGSRRNSTQALATLLAVITWAQPIARARLEEAAAEQELRWTGSTERDADGRLRDRRGFAQAMDSVETLGRLQDNRYRLDTVPTEPGPGVGWHSVLDDPPHPDW